jgi:hypothetical protein
LAKAGRLELLNALGPDLIVPDAVLEELKAKGSDDPRNALGAGSAAGRREAKQNPVTRGA